MKQKELPSASFFGKEKQEIRGQNVVALLL
jgi:hypothetical protein